ncbi:putative type I secretion target repeat protein [Dinoroseobacter shibae DFL 12 = DSM 16493]|uniref:Putative type I secretion target repeat protein n=1 Tax=Dinoroseobacter shibae (strain DSM 16493 / NCIMB 14021 / DFL 12) TaxID=398580 RepID=A8LKN9_DINSH|nr:Hint domain-containing protein [Dinoroseobacter shibae]ABV91882.1 putative type I secretion target repeat protein [Dinoroseobacter shibae DFL 12 = DSM 16493]URF46860.1 Hint domain-containing protein [Dinoroseobacter shibae]URF51171.1 Hint domain-containing protein [Dinoroseobacter shibae]
MAKSDGDHTYTSLGWPNDAYYLAEGTELNVMKMSLVDKDEDGDIGPGDMINGLEVTDSYLGDWIGFDSGEGEQWVYGVTFYLEDGSQVFMATDGTQLQDAKSTGCKWVLESTDVPVKQITAPCFVAGTRILTPEGVVPVETLRPGDLVQTRDHGAQPVLWVGRRTLPGSEALAPIRFSPDALGSDRPLYVSPQHRMLLSDPRLLLLFEEAEVLAAALHLVNGHSVVQAPRARVTYIHLLFARHEIVYAEGIPSESFHPGMAGLAGFGDAARDELLGFFPQLADLDAGFGPCARRVLRAHEAAVAAQLVIGRGAHAAMAA